MILAAALGLSLLGQTALPGKGQMSLEEAQEWAEIIVVAELDKVGLIFGLGAFSLTTDMELKPSATLKGKPEEGELKKLSYGTGFHEIIPERGKEYIFFIGRHKESLKMSIHKILPKTDQGIEAVKKEVKARARG